MGIIYSAVGETGTYQPVETILSKQLTNINQYNPLPDLTKIEANGLSPNASQALNNVQSFTQDLGVNPYQVQTAEQLAAKYATNPAALETLASKGGVYAEAVQNLSGRAIASEVFVADTAGFIPQITLGANGVVETVAAVETVAPVAEIATLAGADFGAIALETSATAIGFGEIGAALAAIPLAPEIGLAVLIGGVTFATGAVLDQIFGDHHTQPLPTPSNGINKGAPTAPLSTGQVAGVSYKIHIRTTRKDNGAIFTGAVPDYIYAAGAIGSLFVRGDQWYITTNITPTSTGTDNPLANASTLNLEILDITRADGTADPVIASSSDPTYFKPLQKPVADSASNFPYYPTVSVSDRAANLSAPSIVLPYKEPNSAKPLPPFPVVPRTTQTKSPLAGSNPTYPSADPQAANVPKYSDDPLHPTIVNGNILPYVSQPQINPPQVNPAYVSGSGIRKANQPLDANQNQVKTEPINQPSGYTVSTQPPNQNGLPQTPNNLKSDTVPTPLKPTPAPTPNNPNSPSFPDLGSIAAQLIALGLSTGAVLTGIDYLKNLNNQINNQTSAANQQANAQQGVCNAFQPNQCGYEGTKQAATEATNPIKDIATNNGNLLATLLSLLNTIWTFLQDKVGKVLELLNNQVIDRSIHLTNMALNFHNAMMLSNNLGKSLAGIVDTVFNIAGLQFTDDQGRKKSATTIFGTATQNFIANVIGRENYIELNTATKVANRIYQVGMNTLNASTRLFHQQAKVIAGIGSRQSDIGNALLVNGVVAPTSYPKMPTSEAANMPNETYVATNSPLSTITDGIKSLNAVTKQVLNTKKQIQGIQNNVTKITDLTNSESNARKAIRTQALAKVKRDTNFTGVQIAQIKIKSK